MLAITPVTDPAVWDAEISALGGHPLQLWGWGEVKAAGAWTAHRVLVHDDETTVGAAQVLVRSLPWPLRRLSYVPRGPAVADEGVRSAVTRAVVDWTRDHVGGIGITVEPPWPRETVLDVPGARPATERVLLPDTLIVDLTRPADDLMADMKQGARQRVRKALRGDLVVREVTDEEIDTIVEVYHQVAARAGFALHPDSYYRRVRTELGARHSPVIAAFDGQTPVAFMWLAASDATAFELYAGATDAGQRLNANYALKWHAWSLMKERGLREYDLNGLLNDGISEFKRGWARHETPLVRAFDVPFGPTYRLWQVGAPAAKRLHRALRRP
ncbi:MAG: peptidoglycan bridge formation glycyltransferase FemA/FemB family protein [Micrococcales bacterium]|nr:peptidoglycan bridge formation glycyltransferase FemA/FemB family protein [Micrococcales bacterium]